MRNLSKKKQVILLVILVVVGIFFLRDSIFGPNQKGKIVLSNLKGNSTIFLDNREARTIRGGNDRVSLSRIEPGFHTVLVARNGHWPWFKEVQINVGEEVTFFPFSVPQNSSGFIIYEEDLEYEEVISLFKESVAPSSESKIQSKDGKTAIWVDSGSLFVEWLGSEEERPEYFCGAFGCDNSIVSLASSASIRGLDFFKERSDVFIVSFGTGVFAIEADKENTQNFQPIFEGKSPEFILDSEGVLYVLDNNLLSLITI